jgi:hypothetical protein
VFDQLGSGSTTSIVAALNWLARFGRSKGIRVANMSLGGPKSWAVCSALDAVVRQGITMVVAAGEAPPPLTAVDRAHGARRAAGSVPAAVCVRPFAAAQRLASSVYCRVASHRHQQQR